MINIILSFLFGCTFIYLVTTVSSALKASTVLEDAMLTYAILLTSAYEVSVSQLETVIVAGKIPAQQAEILRRANSSEFEAFANKKIREILKVIPTSHTNIIRYNNFAQMKLYVTKQYRSRYAKSKQKR
jgi:hypothetical protein|tara:strand:- start:371 stop:757 length:387 start_codon:yes stop_codon:yes gene_type:complete